MAANPRHELWPGLLDEAELLEGLVVDIARFNLRNGEDYRVRLKLAVDAELAPRAPIANMVVRIPARWDLKLPSVWCDDAWVYRNIDWHTQPDGRCQLCWALPEEWVAWITSWRLDGVSSYTIRKRARDWLITSCELLMRRHYLGRILSLETWPDEWDAHAHFGRGVAQFQISGSAPYRITRSTFYNEYRNAISRPAA